MVSSIVIRLKRGDAFMTDCFLGIISFSWEFSKIWSINYDLKEVTEGQPEPENGLTGETSEET